MPSKEEFIEKVVKGMKKNKRSLIQRYGNDAEEVMYAVANKQWDEKMKKSELKEMIRSIIRENNLINVSPVNEVRELSDDEYKIAKEFAIKKGGKLAAMGADDKFLFLSLTMPGKTDEMEFKLDKTGKEIND